MTEDQEDIASINHVYTLGLVVAKIDGKVDLILQGLTHIKEDHEKRIRKLESKQTYLSGAFAVVAVIYGFVVYNVDYVLKFFGKN